MLSLRAEAYDKKKGINMPTEYALNMDYKEQREWKDVPMWTEMAIGAVCGGLFIFSMIFKFALGAVVAVIVMLLGKGFLLLADLGKPERFLKIFAKPGASWIGRGAWALVLFGGVGEVSIAPLIIPGLAWTPWSGGGVILGLAGCVLAVWMMTYEGFFLEDSRGVSFWSSGGLPMVFLTSAAVGGIGAMSALGWVGGFAASPAEIGVFNAALLAVSAISLYAFLRSALNGEGGAMVAANKLMAGELSKIFKFGVVCAGLIFPGCVSLLALFGVAVPGFLWFLTGLAEIGGVVTLRYVILNAGVYSPQL